MPAQVKAATDAYIHKAVLYKNGLTNLVDVTQALYALVSARNGLGYCLQSYGRLHCFEAPLQQEISAFSKISCNSLKNGRQDITLYEFDPIRFT